MTQGRSFRLRLFPTGAPWRYMTNKSCTCRPDPEDLITVSEAAAEAGVSTKTIRRRIWSRELPHHRIGARTILIRRSDLQAWLDQGLVPAVDDKEVL